MDLHIIIILIESGGHDVFVFKVSTAIAPPNGSDDIIIIIIIMP